MTEFERLYERYARDVYRFALYLSGSAAEADDITSETFVRVLTSRDAIRTATVKAYLFTIARNLYVDARRRQSRSAELPGRLADPRPGAELQVQVQARARRLREESLDQILKPAPLALPADQERVVLVKTQRRWAARSIAVNSLALVLSVAMSALYLWKVVPAFGEMFVAAGMTLPAATRFMIFSGGWVVRLVWPMLGVLVLLLLFHRRIRVPEIVRSGVAPAIGVGGVLLATQLFLLVQSFEVASGAYRLAAPALLVNRGMLAMRSAAYTSAATDLEVSLRNLSDSRPADSLVTTLTASVLLADTYAKLGDSQRATESYHKALDLLRSPELPAAGLQDAPGLEKSIREALAALR